MTVHHADPEIPDVSGFIRSCVERAGGVVEAGPSGALDALLPPQLEAIAGGRSWVRLALATDVIADGAEPALLGSPFMDALIAFAASRGTTGAGYLPAGRLKRKGMREEVERTVRFSNCRTRYEYDEADVKLSATAQFEFKVAFFSEERREGLYVVPVNLFSNVVQPELTERLAGLTVEAEPATPLLEAPTVPVEAAYQTACLSLRRVIAEETARRQVRVAQRFAVEVSRISDYYGQAIVGLERRRTREQKRVAGEEIPAGATALEQKIAAVERERDRKLRELGETYGIRVRARLSSARCLWQPKAFFKLTIDRGSITRSLDMVYDGLLERLELPTCESCRRETDRLWASPTARLLCPGCAGQ